MKNVWHDLESLANQRESVTLFRLASIFTVVVALSDACRGQVISLDVRFFELCARGTEWVDYFP